MGAVFEAYDNENQRTVAVKVLPRVDPNARRAFAREFRSALRVEHPNLVTVYALEAAANPPYIVMEYVPGAPFLDAIRSGTDLAPAATQLLDATAALHEADVVHRDLKSDNVLVAEDGRVVVLDFGIASRVRRDPDTRSVSGTPGYLAPELFCGAPASPASDMYAVGVLLYRALTGAWPGDPDDPLTMFNQRMSRSMEHPRRLAPDPTSSALAELTWALLDPDPDRRPTARQALRAIGAGAMVHPLDAPVHDAFIQDLTESGMACAQRGASVIWAFGPTGGGLSRSIDRAASAWREAGIRVLEARLERREHGTLIGLGALVDAMASNIDLSRIPPGDQQAILHLFPSLGLAPLVGERPPPDVWRRSAVRGFRSLLRQVSDQAPTIVWIDDIHALDADSARWIADVGAAPGEPAIVWLLTGRDGKADGLQRLRIRLEGRPAKTHRLGPVDTGDLKRWLDREVPGLDLDVAHQLLHVAGSDLALFQTLARFAARQPGAVSIERWLSSVLEPLPAAASAMVHRCALSEVPLPHRVLSHGLDTPDPEALAARLVGAGVLGRTARGELVLRHQAVRDAVLDTMSSEAQRKTHSVLASALLAADTPPAPQLVAHLLASDRASEVSGVARAAGQRALERGAYLAAARLFAVAEEQGPASEAIELRALRAEALVMGGRGIEAGTLFLDLASQQPEKGQVHTLRAAEQFLYSGAHRPGIDATRRVLAPHGLAVKESDLRSFFDAFLLERRLQWRGYGFEPKTSPDAAALEAIDALHAASLGLSMSLSMTSGAMGYRHLLLALNAGEPVRAARALAIHAAQHAFFKFAPDRTGRHIQSARRLLADHPDDETHALVELAAAGCALAEGRLDEAFELTREDNPVLSRDRPGLRWHRGTWTIVKHSALLDMGRYGEIASLLADDLIDAEARGDLHLATNLKLRLLPRLWCALDDPDRGHAATSDALARWPQVGDFDMTTFFASIGRMDLHAYSGNWASAYNELQDGWARMNKAFMLVVEFAKRMAWTRRGRILVGHATLRGGPSPAERRHLRKAIRVLSASDPIGQAEAACLRAEVAAWTGDDPGPHLIDAIERFRSLRMASRAAAASLALRSDAELEEDLRTLGVVDPEKYVASHHPWALRLNTRRIGAIEASATTSSS